MAEADEYVLPIDHGAVVTRRRIFVVVTVAQVAVVAIVPALIGVVVGSFTVALLAYLLLGIALVFALRKDWERWRTGRAITELPPVLASEGLRLRVLSTSGYDLRVPWSQVTRIVATPRGQHWNLVVHIADDGGLAGDDPVRRTALRKLHGPPGAGLLYHIGYVAANVKELDEAVSGHSGGRLSVERPAG